MPLSCYCLTEIGGADPPRLEGTEIWGADPLVGRGLEIILTQNRGVPADGVLRRRGAFARST